MFFVIGVVLVFATVFGGFIAAGGQLDAVIEAAPMELVIILGSGVGAMVVGNSMDTLKGVGAGFGKVAAGPKWKKQDYQDLLLLLFSLTKLMKSKGVVALEAHIEKPHDSPIFSRYPKIAKDHHVTDLICDTLRMMTMNLDDPHQVENNMEKQLEKHHHEAHSPAHAIQNLADGLPALGIVAAVLGIIKTMGAITEPPAVLGGMIGHALVGTFLGVFVAYGLVAPIAARLGSIVDEEGQFYKIIQDVLVAHLHGNAAQVSVEIGRGSVPSSMQPSFAKLEEAIGQLPND
ncbi:MAG: flagellar motor stator protein MotA [Caulobacterales bacterium]|nr:flagellar motor stator protein MotA [Caulobacterales bacterium]MCA0373701.1 flagellar motor stator protein MotA [Pseudomonadota bacterium]